MRGTAVVVVAMATTVSKAQAQRGSDGPITELAFTLEDRHDSNIARTDRTRAAIRGLELGDWRATPALQLTVARPLGRNTLALTASAGYDFYRRNTQLNRERISVAGNAVLNANACRLTLTPSFSRRQSDLGDLALLSVPGIDSVRNTETVQDYSAELRCGGTYGIQPVLTGSRSVGDNSEPRRRISDYRTWRYGGGLGYNSPVLGEFTALLTRTQTRYPGRPLGLGRSSFDTTRGQLNLTREWFGLITSSGSISYISLDPQQGGTRRFRGIGWNLSLTATPQPDLRVIAGLARDVAPSLGTDALYILNRSYSLGTSYAVSRIVTVGLNGSIDQRRYVGATGVFGPALTSSNQRSLVGTVSASASRRLSVGADVGYQNRNANGTIYDYKDVFFALRTKITL